MSGNVRGRSWFCRAVSSCSVCSSCRSCLECHSSSKIPTSASGSCWFGNRNKCHGNSIPGDSPCCRMAQPRWPWGQSLLQESTAEVPLDVSRVSTGVLTGQNQARVVPYDLPGPARGCSRREVIFFHIPNPFFTAWEPCWSRIWDLGCSEPFGNAGSCCPLIHLTREIVEGTWPKSPGMQIWVFQWNSGFPVAAGNPGQAALAVIRSRICSTIHIHDFPRPAATLIPSCVFPGNVGPVPGKGRPGNYRGSSVSPSPAGNQ